jgi:hypothetical protein
MAEDSIQRFKNSKIQRQYQGLCEVGRNTDNGRKFDSKIQKFKDSKTAYQGLCEVGRNTDNGRKFNSKIQKFKDSVSRSL